MLVLYVWTAVILSIAARLVDLLGFLVRSIVSSLIAWNDRERVRLVIALTLLAI